MKYIASLLASAALAAAHGYVDTASIGGKTYTLYQPYQDPYTNPTPDRISRKIAGNGPVEDVNSIDLQCGGWSAGGEAGSEGAALHATVAAGETVKLFWTLWPESHVGPSITYMAKCPDTGCQDWLPEKEAVWFKIQEEGRDGASNTWGATSLMTEPNDGVQYTIPECLTPGFYLVRHELIALHASFQYPGAQFYPGCHQLEVTGSGNTVPSDLVSFPGAYSPEDPGITYDAYSATEYIIPGPAVFSCGGVASPSGGGQKPSDVETSGPIPTASGTLPISGSSLSAVATSADASLPTSAPESSFITSTRSASSAAGISVSLEPLPTSVPEPIIITLSSTPVPTQPAGEIGDDDECDAETGDGDDDDECDAETGDGEDDDECDAETGDGEDDGETGEDEDDDECESEDPEEGDDECEAEAEE
ncbi:related to cel1 protein precursor [Cephalotrichum gorgonifer]|uniref:lytic cellulose monooxygenase (C4-dehydrogenating) n=1 Tax=Cephalotrichum gorgonifer TaxID=2041049 RepID=A0AAE8SUE0_9PEZI|nr:related to cel1 protein precursor [Cephalotrichum gorgonifer]